jgi:hypothetical protein
MNFTPTDQYFALLALVFMMSYVLVFDKLRWQIKNPKYRTVPDRPFLPSAWCVGGSCSPFRK